MGNTSIIYKLSDSFSLIVIKCPYSKLLAYIHKSNFNIRHVYAYIQLYRIWEVSCDWSVFTKRISYSVEQTLVGGNKSPQDVCEGGYFLCYLSVFPNMVYIFVFVRVLLKTYFIFSIRSNMVILISKKWLEVCVFLCSK